MSDEICYLPLLDLDTEIECKVVSTSDKEGIVIKYFFSKEQIAEFGEDVLNSAIEKTLNFIMIDRHKELDE